jgi:hypothetical protein
VGNQVDFREEGITPRCFPKIKRCLIILTAVFFVCNLGWSTVTSAARYSSPESQHITASLEFLRQMGHREETDRLAVMRKRLYLVYRQLEENDFAKTNNGIITLNQQRLWQQKSPAKGSLLWYTSVYSLAGTLLHELRHIDQGQEYVNESGTILYKWGEGGDPAELEGYGVQFSAQSRWLLEFLDIMLKTSNPEEKKTLRSFICQESSILGAAVAEALKTYGGRNQWQLMGFINPKPLPATRWPSGGYIDSIEDVENLISNIRNDAGCDRKEQPPNVDCSTPRALEEQWDKAVKKVIPGFPHFSESNRKDQMNKSHYWSGWDYSVTTDKNIVPVNWSKTGEKPHIVLNVKWHLSVNYHGHRSADEMTDHYRRSKDNAKCCGEKHWNIREGTFGDYSCLASYGYRGTIDLSMASNPYGAEARAYKCMPCADVTTTVSLQVFAPASHGPRNKPDVIKALNNTARVYAKEIAIKLIGIAGGSVPSIEERIAANQTNNPIPPPNFDNTNRPTVRSPETVPGSNNTDRPEEFMDITGDAGPLMVEDPLLDHIESLLSEDRLREAERALRDLISQKPGVARYNVRLGDVYFLQNRWKAAEDAYRNAIRLEPLNPEHHALLGEVYMAQNNFAKAEKCYLRCRDLAPEDPGYYEILRVIYSETGRHEEAEQAARRASELSR